MDLAFKFKPWGAVKLAGNLNKALPLIGFAFEAWDSWNKYQKACDQEFEKWIKAGKDLIKGEDFIEVEPEEE